MSKGLDIARRFHERMAETTGTRSDLRVTDSRQLSNPHEFKIVVSYDKHLPTPKPAELKQFITTAFNNAVVANFKTARAHTEGRHHGVTLVVTARRRVLPLKAAKKRGFAEIVANTLFMDTEMNENWRVREDATGKQVLECARQEDVAGMLKSAITASTRSNIGLRLGDEAVAGATLPEKGDVVKFYADNAQRFGTVTRVKDDECYIAEEDGNTFIVPNVSVIDIVKKNPKAAQEEMNEEASFYAQYLPKEFVREWFPGAKI